MSKSLVIKTGEPRNVVGHMISASLISGIGTATVNYTKGKDFTSLAKSSVKLAAQAAIATGAAIDISNTIGTKRESNSKIFTSLALGVLGVYLVEKIIK